MRTKIVFGIGLLGLLVLSCAPRADVPVAAQPPVAVAQATTVAELPAVVASPTVAPIETAALIAPAASATESVAAASEIEDGTAGLCAVLSAAMTYSAVDFVFVQNRSFVSGHVRSWFEDLLIAEVLE